MNVDWALVTKSLTSLRCLRLSSLTASDIMLSPGLVHWRDGSSIGLLASCCHEISRNSTSRCRVASSPRSRLGLGGWTTLRGTRTRHGALDYNW